MMSCVPPPPPAAGAVGESSVVALLAPTTEESEESEEAEATRHCQWPDAPWCASQSKFRRFWKYSLLQVRGAVVQGPSNPEVQASSPTPLPHRPGQGFVGSSAGGGPAQPAAKSSRPQSQAPWALPKAWPPPT